MRDEMRIASLKEKAWYKFLDEDENVDGNKEAVEQQKQQWWEPEHYQQKCHKNVY